MKNLSKQLTIIFCIFLINSSIFAQSDYRCLIQRVDQSGNASDNNHEFYVKYYVGKIFTVERTSGIMAGVLKNSYVTQPQVIDIGSNENSYKVVTTMHRDQGAGAGSNVYLLVVKEYLVSSKKPFLFVQNDVIFFGDCEHF